MAAEGQRQTSAAPQRREARQKRRWGRLAVLGIVALLVLGGIGVGVYLAMRGSASDQVAGGGGGHTTTEAASDFSEDLAAVELNGLWGFVDADGAMVVEPQFEQVRDFSDGLAAVELNDKWGFIDKSGTMVIDADFDDTWGFSEGFAAVKLAERWGVINTDGSVVIRPQFDGVGLFQEGLAQVVVGDMFGYIDESGEIVIPVQFDKAWPFTSEGLAVVDLEADGLELWSVVDQTGKVVLHSERDEWEIGGLEGPLFSEGLVPIEVGGSSFGFMDTTGAMVIMPRFNFVGGFHEGLAYAQPEERASGEEIVGYIDKSGEWVIEPQFDGFEPGNFSEGLAALHDPYGAGGDICGYIDKSGAWAIEPRFNEAHDFSQGRALVVVDGVYSFIDDTGKPAW